ncbi:MAG: hemerythrin domain-containing protein [Aquabacterium sp.]
MRPPLQPVAPSIDDPIELLTACHEKVRRFANLALRLRQHLADLPAGSPPDAQARDAASAIVRYFTVAAPLHHEDEEVDLFPALKALGVPEQASLSACIDALHAEHAELAELWAQVLPWLTATAEGRVHPAPAEVEDFARRYIAHAQREEDDVYPGAAHLAPAQVRQISQAMVRRRTAPA